MTNKHKLKNILIFLVFMSIFLPISSITMQGMMLAGENEQVQARTSAVAPPYIFSSGVVTPEKCIWTRHSMAPYAGPDVAALNSPPWKLEAIDGKVRSYEEDGWINQPVVEISDDYTFTVNQDKLEGNDLSSILITVRMGFWHKSYGSCVVQIANHATGNFEYLFSVSGTPQKTYTHQLTGDPDSLKNYINDDGKVKIRIYMVDWWMSYIWYSVPPAIAALIDYAAVNVFYEYDHALRVVDPKEKTYYNGYMTDNGQTLLKLNYDTTLNVEWDGFECTLDGLVVPVVYDGDGQMYIDTMGLTGNHFVIMQGIDVWGDTYYSQTVPFTLVDGFLEKTLIGSENRYFPHVDPARLGFTFHSMDDIKDHVDRNPRISFCINETEDYDGDVVVTVKIDKQEIWSTSVNIGGNIAGTANFDIDAIKLIQPYYLTHQVVVEISNGEGPDDIYKLEYLKIQHVKCQENWGQYDKMLAPVEIYGYGYTYDWATYSMNTQVPYNFEDGIVRTYSPHFVSSTAFALEPGYNGPEEFYTKHLSNQYFLETATLYVKVLDPDGEFVSNTEYSNFLVLPDIPPLDTTLYDAIKWFLETMNLIINLAPISQPFDELLDWLDIYTYLLPDHAPVDYTSYGLIGTDSAYGRFQNNIPWTLHGFIPDYTLSGKFWMLVDWDINLPRVNPEKFGSYQVITTWSFKIDRLTYQSSPNNAAMYGYEIHDAFPLTETSYINFIYDPGSPT